MPPHEIFIEEIGKCRNSPRLLADNPAAYPVRLLTRWEAAGVGGNHVFKHTRYRRRRRDAVAGETDDAWTATRLGHVRRRSGCAADHRGSARPPPEQRAILISADILACGLASLVQSLGFPFVGIRMPVMMGLTVASVAPMLALIASAKEAAGAGFVPSSALLTVYGSVIGAGVFALLAAPLMSSLVRLFPAVVTGSIILVIGVSLMKIGVDWAEGPRMVPHIVDGAFKGVMPNPNRDALDGFAPIAARACRHSHRQQVRQGLRRQYLGADRHRRRPVVAAAMAR